MSVISVFCPKIMKLFAKSICTHYFSLSGPPDIFLGSGTLRKRSKIWVAKSRVQKTRISVIQKEKKQPGLFSFWITMTQFFCTLFFETHSLYQTFFRVTNRPMFSKQEQWVQIDWKSMSPKIHSTYKLIKMLQIFSQTPFFYHFKETFVDALIHYCQEYFNTWNGMSYR